MFTRPDTLQLELAVAEELSRTGVSFRRDVYVHGIQVDFVVMASPTRLIVVEIKNWGPTARNVGRAAAQARMLKEITGFQEAYVLLPNLERNQQRPGVIQLADLNKVFGKMELKRGADRERDSLMMHDSSFPVPEKSVFAAMPFAEQYDDVFFVAMAYAAEQAKTVIRRTDKEPFEGDVVERIHGLIGQATAVIADLSEGKPNVMYEVGYAHALKLTTIPICSTPLEELPFDVRNWNVLPYTKGRTFELRDRLAKRLKAAIGG